jgi:hypothetical protein
MRGVVTSVPFAAFAAALGPLTLDERRPLHGLVSGVLKTALDGHEDRA